MKLSNICVLLAGLVILLANVAIGNTIYSNLGPGGSFSSTNGWSIGYPFGPDEVGQSMAFSFIPDDDYYLESVELAIGNGSPTGSSEFIAAIYQDSANKPGILLASTLATAPSTAHVGVPPASTTQVLFSGTTILSNQTRYWIGLHPAAAQPTDLGWWWNSDDAGLQSTKWQSNTPSEVLIGGNWETTGIITEPAYAIEGTVVPEPTTISLLAIGSSLLLFRRKKE